MQSFKNQPKHTRSSSSTTTDGLIWFKTYRVLLLAVLFIGGVILSPHANAERLKDLASIQGVRNNQLLGYGLVVGLDGTGDQTTQTPFTVHQIFFIGVNPSNFYICVSFCSIWSDVVIALLLIS